MPAAPMASTSGPGVDAAPLLPAGMGWEHEWQQYASMKSTFLSHSPLAAQPAHSPR